MSLLLERDQTLEILYLSLSPTYKPVDAPTTASDLDNSRGLNVVPLKIFAVAKQYRRREMTIAEGGMDLKVAIYDEKLSRDPTDNEQISKDIRSFSRKW